MKRDFIYQDKGQFKLLQNAERIGGFYVGDQGVIPSERVLPEQKFAHQPVFQRPPEEMVTNPYYLMNYAGHRSLFVMHGELERAESLMVDGYLLRTKGLVRLKEPTPTALALEDKFFVQGLTSLSLSELSTLMEYFLSPRYGRVGDWTPDDSFNTSLVIFKGYVFYMQGTPPSASPNWGKPWYLYAGRLDGKIVIKDAQQASGIPVPGNELQDIYFVFMETVNQETKYGLITRENPPTFPTVPQVYVRYRADLLTGPWAVVETWDVHDQPGDPPDAALLALVTSESVAQLSIGLSSYDAGDLNAVMMSAQVYGEAGRMWGRGKDTELYDTTVGGGLIGKRNPVRRTKEVSNVFIRWKGENY